jgi:putative OPT family oligopeptide transporter
MPRESLATEGAKGTATAYINASVTNLPELTLRGCLLAILITIVFTAGNVYMGLKISFTFNSAIPAAVISMAILRFFRTSNILENTMVQTFASAAGTLSAVIFVLPALLMLGYWTSFPFWQTMLLCATGGLLGVMFTIPLRRALVVNSDLPYPEGVAAAEILRVGDAKGGEQKKTGVWDIAYGTLIAGAFTLFSRGFHWFAESFAGFAKIGLGVTGFSMDYSLALIGAGYLTRIRAGVAMLIGFFIAWGIAVPYLSWNVPVEGSIMDVANHIWSTKVRVIGVGTIAVAAIWTMLLLLNPIWTGIQSSLEALAQIRTRGKDSIIRTEKDIPITTVLMCVALLIIPLLAIFGYFIIEEHLPLTMGMIITLTIVCVVFVVFLSFITAAVCGYMAGLVGSSNSPVSSIGVLATITASLLLLVLIKPEIHAQYSHLTIALVIYMASAVIAAACTSNDNMQDLKTGQLLGATPWRQQVALVMGVGIGALVIPVILQVLYIAYGFPGSLPHAGMNPAEALSAPQAMMMSTIASGIITHNLDWGLIGIGAGIAIFFIILDSTYLKRRNWRLSVVAMGTGMYLPASATTALVVGTLLSFIIERTLKKREKLNAEDLHTLKSQPLRRGTLLASGLIVGESLVGVIIALFIAVSGNQYPIRLVSPEFAPIAEWLALPVFIAILVFNYYYVVRKNRDAV